ncbi:MAG: diguanylate cyclase, partial [Lachnospiraceae bacterium]|nr:diguanylate cyclase [Lachnospiraceae bacterium]
MFIIKKVILTTGALGMSMSLGSSWESDFDNALRDNGVGLMFFDEDCRLRRASNSAINAGFVKSTDLGLKADDIEFPEEYANFAKDIHDALENKKELFREVLRKNKAWLFTARPYVLNDNQVCGVTTICVDITRTKTLETRAHSLMKNMSVAAVEGLYSDETGLELLNAVDTMSRLLGYGVEEYTHMVESIERYMYLQEVFYQMIYLAQAVIKGDRAPVSQLRIRRKDGKVIWLEARCELVGNTLHRTLVQFIFIDVTRSYSEQEKLRMEKKKLAYIIEMTSDTLFEYNVARDVMVLAKQENNVEVETVIDNYTTKLTLGGNVHADDEEIVNDYVDKLRGGAREIKSTFRRKLDDGQYHWLRIEGRTIYSIEGKPDMVVGRIMNVDEEKHREEELTKSAERDSLTGLYNHLACIDKIKKQMARIKGNEVGYLVVIDVDNFKRINDENGHLYGDATLCSLSDAMKSNFPTGIKGRIGGDEFMIFVKNIELDDLKKRLSNVLNEFSKLGDESSGSAELSCSMGVAVCRKGNHDYEQAFETADRALYLIKETGKNSYTICEIGDNVLEDGHRYIAEQEEGSDVYDKEDALISNDDELVMFAVELMNSVSNYRKGLGIVADRVCSYVGFDDMAFITSSENAFATEFDWTGDKAHPYAKKLYPKNQRSNWSEIEEMFADGREYVVIRGKKLKELDFGEYKSMLVARIQTSGVSAQYIAYMDKSTDRTWERERDVLIRLTHMLVSRIVRMLEDERNREEIEYRINYDALTGLPSYTKFLEMAEEYIQNHVPSDEKDYYLA